MAKHSSGTVGAGRKKPAPRRPAVRTGARAKTGTMAAAKPAAKPAVKAPKPHRFMVHRMAPDAFKADGLRSYAQYRDLGVRDATGGMVVAHVIRLAGPCDPKVVSKEHYHAAEFQMIYVLKGSITSWFKGYGTHTMTAGDAWLQPRNIRHKVLDYSDDCEVLEIVMPANFKTVELEA